MANASDLLALHRAQGSYQFALLSKRGVRSVGQGVKEQHGRSVGVPCIRVGVQRKISKAALSMVDLVPTELVVDGHAVPTDVIEVGDMKYRVDETKYRPVEGGAAYNGGTVCGIAIDLTDSSIVWIGTRHNFNLGGPGGIPTAIASGLALIQPPLPSPPGEASNLIGYPKRLVTSYPILRQVGWQTEFSGWIAIPADAGIASFVDPVTGR